MQSRDIVMSIDGTRLDGALTTPYRARGLVMFAHGSGSSRLSPRNRAVAATLVNAGLATRLFDLLDRNEERVDSRTAIYRFDIPLLANRLSAANDAAVGAVVSRGGRPDLAGDTLEHVSAPTLLIVGACDEQVLHLNRLAAAHLTCETAIEIVPGAPHLFEEPGALDMVARLAASWFIRWLSAGLR
ncbi:dienelactone hydrolase family protein [Burkholderia ubonensis]|uniref:dienelactone hydrolase family protein n=1 Tax=Burkholderia ubonensis TaxID=101571 RepID=UPI00358F62FB